MNTKCIQKRKQMRTWSAALLGISLLGTTTARGQFKTAAALSDHPSAEITLGNSSENLTTTGGVSFAVVAGDCNGDGVVDLLDFETYASCAEGPGAGTSDPACQCVNLDANGDVDMRDFAMFQRAFGTAEAPFSGPLFPGPKFAAGNGPESVAIGDLNGDGNPDLAVANAGSDDVSVLLGSGDGTFATEQRFAAGNGTMSVAIGDLNGDGNPDLVVANLHTEDVLVLLNQRSP